MPNNTEELASAKKSSTIYIAIAMVGLVFVLASLLSAVVPGGSSLFSSPVAPAVSIPAVSAPAAASSTLDKANKTAGSAVDAAGRVVDAGSRAVDQILGSNQPATPPAKTP